MLATGQPPILLSTWHGFAINKDISPAITLHTSIADLFQINSNTSSNCLRRYHQLLPHIAAICSGPSCPQQNQIHHFENNISPHSARDRIKSHCGSVTTSQIYTMMSIENANDIHLLPSILSPQTSYPLIGMSRSFAHHRLPNWAFQIALRRKLRLPIFEPTNCPTCKCNTTHDCFGDHTFNCRTLSKKAAHNIIRDSLASGLQPALATAGYMSPSSTIDIERQDINTSDISARPFDFSFDPDPPTNTSHHTTCPYTTIGADITIAHSGARIPDFELSENAIPSLTASADKHLQKFERKKYMRCNKREDSPDNTLLTGDQVIGDLLKQNMILIPIAIDPHGRWGPITENFLNLLDRDLNYTFPAHRPNAANSTDSQHIMEIVEDTTILRTILHSPDSFDLHHTTNRTWNH